MTRIERGLRSMFGALSRRRMLEGPWSVCFLTVLLLVLGWTAAFPPPAAEGAQQPPIGIGISPREGWEEVTAEGAAAVLRRREGGRVVAVLNVVISEGPQPDKAAITDPGVAEGLEHELVSAVPGARAVSRAFSKVAGFEALSVTVEVTIDGKPKVLRQTTVDVRRGAVTITLIADAAIATRLLAEADDIIGAMVIDAAQ